MKTPNKVVYASNFSLEEQLISIKKYMDKNSDKIEPISINILNKSYSGYKYDNFLFLEEKFFSKNKVMIDKIIDIDIFIWIFQRLNELKVHRNFLLKIHNSNLEVTDILLNKKFSINNSINNNVKDFEINIDSRLFSIFRINKKTLNKKTKFIVLNNYYGFLLKRKKRNFLLLKTLD